MVFSQPCERSCGGLAVAGRRKRQVANDADSKLTISTQSFIITSSSGEALPTITPRYQSDPDIAGQDSAAGGLHCTSIYSMVVMVSIAILLALC